MEQWNNDTNKVNAMKDDYMPSITEDGSDYFPLLPNERLVITRLDTDDALALSQDDPDIWYMLEALADADISFDIQLVTLQ